MRSYKPVRILLVEDNPDDILITERALQGSRVVNELHIARDGQEALDLLFGDTRLRPDLILLDVNLPRANGMEVLEKVRADEELGVIPVIMLTASDREEDIVNSYELGSNTYIQKPVEFEKFLHALKVLGEYWIVIAKLPSVA